MAAKNEKLAFEPIYSGTKAIGFRVTGMLMFSDFTEQVEGKEWAQPLRARGNAETLELAGEVVDGKWIQPEDYATTAYKALSLEDAPLYVLEDGNITTDPYVNGTKIPAPGVLLEQRAATPHRDFRTNLVPENILWPDAMVRKLAITIKANNPVTVEAFAQKKVEQSRRMQASAVKGAKTAADLDEIIRLATEQQKKLLAAKAPAA